MLSWVVSGGIALAVAALLVAVLVIVYTTPKPQLKPTPGKPAPGTPGQSTAPAPPVTAAASVPVLPPPACSLTSLPLWDTVHGKWLPCVTVNPQWNIGYLADGTMVAPGPAPSPNPCTTGFQGGVTPQAGFPEVPAANLDAAGNPVGAPFCSGINVGQNLLTTTSVAGAYGLFVYLNPSADMPKGWIAPVSAKN